MKSIYSAFSAAVYFFDTPMSLIDYNLMFIIYSDRELIDFKFNYLITIKFWKNSYLNAEFKLYLETSPSFNL